MLGDDANPGTVKGGAEAGKVPISSFFFFFFCVVLFFLTCITLKMRSYRTGT